MANTVTPAFVQLANAGQFTSRNAGAALANTTTLTDISPGGNTAGRAFALGAGELQLGSMLRIRANGIYSTTGTPTLLLGVYYGAVAGVALAATSATTTATGVANGVWILDADIEVTAEGTAGTAVTIGSVLGIGSPASTPVLMPATSATGGSAAIDTSTAKLLTVGAQWGTAAAGNTITCYQMKIWIDT